MLVIDGSQGEGGGQILRSSVGLSLITGTPFRIENIRGRRSKPGLLRQHLTAVQAAVEISGGMARGDKLRSRQLEFAPGPYPEIEISVTCGSGTYIRTLADDLARALGGRAHLAALRRTTIGNRTVDAATTVEDLDSLEDPATQLLPMAVGLDELGEVVIDEETVPGVSNGVVFPAGALGVIEPGSYRVTDEGGRLLAVYVSDGRRAKPEVVLA